MSTKRKCAFYWQNKCRSILAKAWIKLSTYDRKSCCLLYKSEYVIVVFSKVNGWDSISKSYYLASLRSDADVFCVQLRNFYLFLFLSLHTIVLIRMSWKKEELKMIIDNSKEKNLYFFLYIPVKDETIHVTAMYTTKLNNLLLVNEKLNYKYLNLA